MIDYSWAIDKAWKDLDYRKCHCWKCGAFLESNTKVAYHEGIDGNRFYIHATVTECPAQKQEWESQNRHLEKKETVDPLSHYNKIPLKFRVMMDNGKFEQGKVFPEIRQYIDKLKAGADHQNIIIQGGTYKCKTGNMAFLAKETRERSGRLFLFGTPKEIVMWIYGKSLKLDDLIAVEHLYIDDIDKMDSEKELKLILTILDGRDKNCLTTICTTNKNKVDLALAMSDYSVNRLYENSFEIRK